MRLGSLFSGVGGLDLGLEACGMTTVWQCEIDVAAAGVLARHWDVPNHGDLTTVDWSTVEPVDVLCGGFPCQDLSYAGKGAGLAGARSGLWSEYTRAIRSLRPRHVVVENVAALVGRGMGRVLGDLAALGYDARWGCIRASDAGAPHRRERVFIVAADADDKRSDWSGACSGRWPEPSHGGDVVTDRAVAWGKYEPAIRRWESIVGPAPVPVDERERLSPSFVEWMVGLPVGWTDVGISRTARLKGLGNIVVPQQGALAWTLLGSDKQAPVELSNGDLAKSLVTTRVNQRPRRR